MGLYLGLTILPLVILIFWLVRVAPSRFL